MSEVVIKKVDGKKDLKKFIEFNYSLYRSCPNAIPDLYSSLVDTFTPGKNAGYEFSEVQPFIACRGSEVVGRIVAIINRKANEKWNTRTVRFGWIDFIDDEEVSKALLETVEQWGRERGMNNVQGPLGITDLDKEGMLVEGFDEMGTLNGIYNHAYYPRHLERLGYVKDVDWLEMHVLIPNPPLERHARLCKMVQQRYNVSVCELKSTRELLTKGYGKQILELVNKSYKDLYGFSELTTRQIDEYVKSYMPMLDHRLVCLVVDNDTKQLVGAGVSMPSLGRALQKAHGRLFPFGWFHLLKALKWKHSDTVELMLIGVDPEYQNKGINAIIFQTLIERYNRLGFVWANTDYMLESNTKVLAEWKQMEHKVSKRRRCYTKNL